MEFFLGDRMPRMERVVRVFVASPDDLKSERRRLEQVIQGFNPIWSRLLNIRCDLLRWETIGIPGFGEDPQDVLNQEMPDDYEIFIGLMWCKFGTPTGRAGSGTEEEFNKAYRRFQKDSSSVKIMFYFKEARVSPTDIDPVQLGRVQAFRSSLGMKGGLYWTFKTGKDFEGLVRNHLTNVLQEFSAQPEQNIHSSSENAVEQDSPEIEEDLGLIDYLDRWDDSIERLEEVSLRIAKETENIGHKLRERTNELNKATEEAKGQVSRQKARDLIGKAASDLQGFVDKMRIEVPQFDDILHETADAAAQIVRISISDTPENRVQLKDANRELGSLYEALDETHNSISDFQEAIRDLPRMAAVMNKAKREAIGILQQFIDSMAAGKSLMTETLHTMESPCGNGEVAVNYDNMPERLEEFIEKIEKGGHDASSLLRDLCAVERCARCADEIINTDFLDERLEEHYNLPETPGIYGIISNSEFSPDHFDHSGFCARCGDIFDKDD